MCKKILAILFCGVLGLSFLVFNIFSKQLSGDNHENRLLTGLPQVLQSPPSQLFANLNSFIADNSPFRYQLVELNANASYLLFGKETRGLPESLLRQHSDCCLRIPIRAEARSLNLANSVAIVTFEALRQQGFPHLSDQGLMVNW